VDSGLRRSSAAAASKSVELEPLASIVSSRATTVLFAAIAAAAAAAPAAAELELSLSTSLSFPAMLTTPRASALRTQPPHPVRKWSQSVYPVAPWSMIVERDQSIEYGHFRRVRIRPFVALVLSRSNTKASHTQKQTAAYQLATTASQNPYFYPLG